MPVKTTESISWSYGGMAFRSDEDYRFWNCHDSDYSWKGVVDDFGNLATVSSYKNDRGY